MKKIQLSKLARTALFAGLSLATSVAPSFAAVISFSVSAGTQPTNVGTITITDVNATTVNVAVNLLNSSYGFLNTGGPHTPFAFNIGADATSVSGLPSGFSLNNAGGDNTPFGTFDTAIDKSGGNGSGNAYYGNLNFNVVRASGLTVGSFVANSDGYFFSADLTDGQNTGAQGWKVSNSNIVGTPDGGMTAALLGLALVGMAIARRFGLKS